MTAITEIRDLPATGTWTIDAAHSSVEFVVRHLVVAKTRGSFDEFTGEIHVGESPETSSVEVEIAAGSVRTGDAQRDAHLKSPDFFDVEQFPTLTFRSTGVRVEGGDRYSVDGDLTLRGVTKPVTLDLTYQGRATDPWGNEKAVFSARTELDREDWGLTYNQALETGGVLVGKTARIEIEVEAARSA